MRIVCNSGRGLTSIQFLRLINKDSSAFSTTSQKMVSLLCESAPFLMEVVGTSLGFNSIERLLLPYNFHFLYFTLSSRIVSFPTNGDSNRSDCTNRSHLLPIIESNGPRTSSSQHRKNFGVCDRRILRNRMYLEPIVVVKRMLFHENSPFEVIFLFFFTSYVLHRVVAFRYR